MHSCAADVPIALLRAAGADAVALDAALVTTTHYDALGEAVDAGVSLWLGVLPGTDATIDFESAATTARRLWSELGFAPRDLAARVVADAGLRTSRLVAELRAPRSVGAARRRQGIPGHSRIGPNSVGGPR